MLGYSKSAAVVLIHLFLLLGNAYGAPTIPEKRTAHSALRVARDGENLAQSTTVTVTNVLDTSVGQMLQICTIQLDPITGDNGEPLVRETKSCKVTMANSGNNSSGSGSSSGTDSSSASDASSTSANASSTASDASATSTADSSSATGSNASSTTDAASASATSTSGGAVSGGSVTLVPGSNLPSGATGADSATATATGTGSAASASATASSGAKAVQGNGFTTIDASAVSSRSPTATATASGTDASVAGAASSASSAADQAATSAAKFQLPGTHLSVLPIGLGVFAGISVIALIVVGLVTYERTKYRKAFRQRKLAESGAAMGYGGMAQAA